MKKMKVLFGVLVAALSTFVAQNVYAVDDFSVAYTVTEPVAGATIPQTVEATFTAPGEEPAAQTLNLFWYEVNGYGSTYKKVDYSTFKVGRTYRPSVVDINFTSTTYTHNPILFSRLFPLHILLQQHILIMVIHMKYQEMLFQIVH